MGAVKINGTTSGSVSLEAPATGSDVTLTLPTLGFGKILQVVSTTKTDTFTSSVAQGSSVAVTGLTATITPTSVSSKILVLASITGSMTSRNGFFASLEVSGSSFAIGDAASNRSRVGAGAYLNITDTDQAANLALSNLHSPATTSATTYGIRLINAGTGTQTVYLNRSTGDPDTVAGWRSSSTITVMEVAA